MPFLFSGNFWRRSLYPREEGRKTLLQKGLRLSFPFTVVRGGCDIIKGRSHGIRYRLSILLADRAGRDYTFAYKRRMSETTS